MAKDRTCILCDIVYSSKQDMDEHMRSMLHHRELENLKGRDCGHECRACGIKVVSLTDYANHISSTLHKSKVEHQTKTGEQDEEYFDKELVQLIQKRKELIRKEEAAAMQAREEEEDATHLWRQERPWQQPRSVSRDQNYPRFPLAPKGSTSLNRHESWRGHSPNRYRSHQYQQNKSATWHAEEPPNFQNWGSRDWQRDVRSNQGNGWGNRRGNHSFCAGNSHRSSWTGSDCNYGGNGSFYRQDSRETRNPSRSMSTSGRDHQKPHSSIVGQKKAHQEKSPGEQDHSKNKGSKLGSSSLKMDKVHRWSPYPSLRLDEPSPQLDAHSSSELNSMRSPEEERESLSRADRCSEGQTQSDQRSQPQNCPEGQTVETDHVKQWRTSTHGSKNKGGTDAGSQTSTFSNKIIEESTKSSQVEWNVRIISDMLRKAKKRLLEKRDPIETTTPRDHQMDAKARLHIEENEEADGSEMNGIRESDQSERVHKDDEAQQLTNKDDGSLSKDSAMQSDNSASDSTPSLQSLQVSTSTIDFEEDEECMRKDEEKREMTGEQCMQIMEDGLGSDSEGTHHNNQNLASGSLVPTLSKLALPACIKRDLSRHISARGKTGVYEPNLNIARRIRNVSGTQKGEVEKDSGLKPTLRQLISSSGCRRNVNWDQVYQEVCRKKQEQGKGMPRFGIEMVPSQPEAQNHMANNHGPISEEYHMESLFESHLDLVSTSSRKRSLSESNVFTDRSSSALSFLTDRDAQKDISAQVRHHNPELKGCVSPMGDIQHHQDNLQEPGQAPSDKAPESVEGDSSCASGTEFNDTQGSGKKRRAAADIVSPEIPNLERKNKRQKIRAKKDCSSVDQLLAVSLREEELNNSLQTVENNLGQARAALQAAYMEVQRLLMVKQQITMEMNSLRNKRIDLLQGMQGGSENVSSRRAKNRVECGAHASASPSPVSSLTELPALLLSQPPRSSLTPFPSHTVGPPALPSVLPTQASTLPVGIKQEPLSPVNLTPELTRTESPASDHHITTPEPCTLPDIKTEAKPVGNSDCNIMVELRQTRADPFVDVRDMSWNVVSSDFKSPQSAVSPKERTVDPPTSLTSETPSIHPLSPKPSPPPSIPEAKSVKRVRKLKKKRVLRKAQSADQPENSDTELDEKASISRPVRKLRQRQRASGCQSSTSTPTPFGEEQVGDGREHSLGDLQEPASPSRKKEPASPSSKKEPQDSDSSELEMVELPKAVPTEVVSLDTSDTDKEESTSKARRPSKDSAPTPLENMSPEPQKLACDEVTSTSEVVTNSSVKSDESEMKTAQTGQSEHKASSDISSDPGEGEEPSEGLFKGHKEAVNGMQIHNGLLYTCSGDRTVRIFDLMSHKCVAVLEGHSTKVNCLLVSHGLGLPHRLYTGSSDQTIRCYNITTREFLEQLCLPDRVLCLHSRWRVLYAGLANGSVVTFNLKTNKQLDVFDCHGPRAVSCLATAQEGARCVLLVGSYDSTISVRDARSGLLLRTLEGHTKTVLCMKVVNDVVFSGSSDQSVHAHNIHTGELVKIYKGHNHAVTVVDILGKVMVTACLDKLVRVYELQSHDRLQVYGGHTDMVMCMVIHKSMIYTGCYDGSIRAVRLNLMQNYRCRWHGCSLIFGVVEHLVQHLLNDHTNPSLQTMKCRWRNCDAFFTSRNSSRQVMQRHLHSHAEEEGGH
ncbi:zinc finger protein 106 [Chanos chanos]|uniref:Zinc finger protein 106 n=1 Tax=Chanos chanos TaxID=29144 RepID=A0A6J2WFY0_CHACN|nr:zinc finger protein 106 [Chanos chanos]